MKKLILSTFIFIISFSAKSQIHWVHEMSVAESIAVANQKFIIIDFWATWCTPCLEMDKRLWQSDEVKEFAEKAVFLKINIDNNAELARDFNIRSIPTVIMISPGSDKLWENIGYRSNFACLDLLKNLPKDISPIVDPIQPFIDETEIAKDFLAMGKGYQQLGKDETHVSLKRAFLSESDKYLKKSGKCDKELKVKADLFALLNQVYRNKFKTATKKLAKLKIDKTETDTELTDLKNLIVAYCCKANNDTDGFKTACAKIVNKTLLAELVEE